MVVTGQGNRTDRTKSALLGALTREGPLSRAELATRTGVPLSTVIDVVARLLAEGAVDEIPAPRREGRGRPASLLRLHPATGFVAFCGVNRTGLQAAVIAGDGTQHSKRTRMIDYSHPDGDLSLLVDLTEEVLTDAGLGRHDLRGIVLSIPAPIHEGRPTLLNPDVPWLPAQRSGRIRWIGSNPGAVFESLFGAPVIVENDANLAALGEAVHGAGRPHAIVVYAMLAGGLGGGVTVRKQLLRGATGMAGEFGHLHVLNNGPLCVCGARGCLGVVNDLGEALVLMEPVFGQVPALERVSTLCASGHRPTLRVLFDLGTGIGTALGAACVVLNPDAVVVDGTLGDAAGPIIEGIRHGIERHAPAASIDALTLLPGALHEDAPIYGALALCHDRLRP